MDEIDAAAEMAAGISMSASWPQAAAISCPREYRMNAGNPLSIMWWNPTRGDFIVEREIRTISGDEEGNGG